MKIKEITYQHRRDFHCIYECEHCGYTEEGRGYDDANFHHNVIPLLVCDECDEMAPESYVPRETRYPEGFHI